MTPAAIAIGLTAKYPRPAAKAKAFYHWLKWMGPWDGTRAEEHAGRAKSLTFWTHVCLHLERGGLGDA